MKSTITPRSFWSWVGVGIVVVSVAFVVGGLTLLSWCVWWDCSCRDWLVTGSDSRESGSMTLRNLGFVVGGLVAVGFGIWRGLVANRQSRASQDQAETARRGLLNERYQRGAEMLGSPVLAVRLGGIYALEGLAEDEPDQYHVQVMRLFSAFARNPTQDDSPRPSGGAQGSGIIDYLLRQDVQAVMTAIGTRSDSDIELEKKADFKLLLSCANLSGAYLKDANLSRVTLFDTDLSRAYLQRANLSGASLTYANLSEVLQLKQDQLDQARADPANPPKLDNAADAETGAPLKWRGGPVKE